MAKRREEANMATLDEDGKMAINLAWLPRDK